MESILKPENGVLKGIDRNINAGKLQAIAITASSYTTGQSISWVHGKELVEWERGHRKSIVSDLTIDHIMASTSLPMLFPSVYVDGSWYGDGGIRLTAPLAPAIHMGAKKLLAISTRHISPQRNELVAKLDDYPSPAKVIGAMYSAIFLDVFDNDALRLERINHLLKGTKGKNPENLEPIKLLLLRPSEDLGDLAAQYEPRLPSAFRFMTRGWGTQENQSTDMLSLVMFQSDYLQHLIHMGERDAEQQMPEIRTFLYNDE
jgi:NTE family protein